MKQLYFKIGFIFCIVIFVLSWPVVKDVETTRLTFVVANLFPTIGMAIDAWREKSKLYGIGSLVCFCLIFAGIFMFWKNRS